MVLWPECDGVRRLAIAGVGIAVIGNLREDIT